MVGELPQVDLEKQRNDGAADGGGGPENAAEGQSQELVEKVIEVVVVDCVNKGESQPERDSNSHEECRYMTISFFFFFPSFTLLKQSLLAEIPDCIAGMGMIVDRLGLVWDC